jgi:hypothetical protein
LDLGLRLSSLAFVFAVWTLVFVSPCLPSSSRLSLLEARGPSLAKDAEPVEDLVIGPEMVRKPSVDVQSWHPQHSPCDRDELDPVIFLNAPKIFHPTPFMLATRTNKNEREQLDSGYVSEIEMKLLHKSFSFKSVDKLAAMK